MSHHINEAYCRLRCLLLRYPRATVADSFIQDDKIIITLILQMDGHLPFQRMTPDLLLLRVRQGRPLEQQSLDSEPPFASREEWDQLAALIPDWDLIEDGFSEV